MRPWRLLRAGGLFWRRPRTRHYLLPQWLPLLMHCRAVLLQRRFSHCGSPHVLAFAWCVFCARDGRAALHGRRRRRTPLHILPWV
jgi:hypothetical protein